MRELLFKLYKFKLLKRIIPSILKRINKLFIKSYITIHHDSFKLKLNLNNPIDREIFLTKGLPDDTDREFIDYQIENVEEILNI